MREEPMTKGDKGMIIEEVKLSITIMSTTTTMVKEISTKEREDSEDHTIPLESAIRTTSRDLNSTSKRGFKDQMVEELMMLQQEEEDQDQLSREGSTTIRTKMEEDQDIKVDISITGSPISKAVNRERIMEVVVSDQATMARDLIKTIKEAREFNNTNKPIRIRSEEAISSKREEFLQATIAEEEISRDHLMLGTSNRETSSIEVMVPDRLA
jgi:hypothetical protein